MTADSAGPQEGADDLVVKLELRLAYSPTLGRLWRTDSAGRFRFFGNDNHSLQLEAETAGLGRSDRRVVRLWFRAQNVTLAEPLRLGGKQP